MSIGPTGGAAPYAGMPLAQTQQDSDRTAQQASNQSRATQSGLKAESAAGIGESSEQHEASDRDADGRRLWEEPPGAGKSSGDGEPAEPQRAPDPHGERGTQLDLSG